MTSPSNEPEPGNIPPTIPMPAASTPPPGGYPPPPGTYPPPGVPYPGYPMVDQWGRPVSDKSKMVAGILQILLPFGIGRFYIGDNTTAVWQLIVTLITCGLGHIWSIIDGVLILINGGTDSQGRVLRD